ncbi:MAG: MFS transporter [Planctomycetes bacterium]|nr:MFS transporter [Planctomycetota bacterium]
MGTAELAAILSVFGFGICMLFFGSIKSSVQQRLGVDDAQIGYLGSTLLLASTPAVLFLGILLDKLGPGTIIIFGFAGTAVCFLLIGWLRSYRALFAIFILLAATSSCLNSGGNALLPALKPDNPAAASNLGNTFFGLGALLTPVIVNILLRRQVGEGGKRVGFLSLPWTMTVLAVVVFLPVFVAAAATYPPLSRGFSFSTALGLLKGAPVWLGGVTLFCYIGLESSIAMWTTTLFTKGLGTSEGKALNRLTAFFVCLMLGRLIASQLDRVGFDVTSNGPWLLVALGLVAAAVTVLLTLVKDIKVATVLMIVLGFCYAPIFPTTVGVTFSRYSSDVFGSVFGLIFAIGLLSASVFPTLIGTISKRKNIQLGFVVLALASVGLAILAAVMGRAYAS